MRIWAVVLAVLLALAAPARAQSDRYTSPPTAEGPLVASVPGPACEERELRGPRTSDGHHGVCEWHYNLLPAAENDLEHEYGATWTQMDFDPPTGTCIGEVKLGYAFEGAEVVSATRSGAKRYKAATQVRETLEVDAGGEASSSASVFTDTVMQRGRVKARATEDSIRYSWRGRSSKPVSIVLGWQLRFTATEPIYTVLSTSNVLIVPC
jgi:hypothetical protein